MVLCTAIAERGQQCSLDGVCEAACRAATRESRVAVCTAGILWERKLHTSTLIPKVILKEPAAELTVVLAAPCLVILKLISQIFHVYVVG